MNDDAHGEGKTQHSTPSTYIQDIPISTTIWHAPRVYNRNAWDVSRKEKTQHGRLLERSGQSCTGKLHKGNLQWTISWKVRLVDTTMGMNTGEYIFQLVRKAVGVWSAPRHRKPASKPYKHVTGDTLPVSPAHMHKNPNDGGCITQRLCNKAATSKQACNHCNKNYYQISIPFGAKAAWHDKHFTPTGT